VRRRGGKDRFTKTWSKDQAEQQKKDRAQQVPPPDAGGDTVTYSYAPGGLVPPLTSKWVIDEYQRSMNRLAAATLFGAPTPSPAFSGSEFAMGSAIGVRSWDVDRLGRLISPSYKTTWVPGEMLAECRIGDRIFLRNSHTVVGDHKQSECACGFYAYYKGFNEYAQEDRITGVIEGYGETQIGTRGFKCAKAKIVALHIPDASALTNRIGKTPFERVRDNYGPHVAIFTDYAQMVSGFPTTQPEDYPTPDTDPDFWTRSAS